MEKHLENPRLLTLARFFSFLGLLFLTMKTFLLVALCSFMSTGNMVILRLSLFLGIGIVLGMLLCPLFIPSPGQKKPVSASIVFILFLIVPNIALRSLGLQRWLNSEVISDVISTLTNMLYPLCYGLFFMTHLLNTGKASANRTGWLCVFLFAIAIAAGMAGRYGLLPALALFGIALDPLISMALLYTIILWLIVGTGASALVCVTLLNVTLLNVKLPDKAEESTSSQSYSGCTDWRLIFSLIGISVVSKVLNSLMGIRFLPLINYSFWTEKYLLILMVGGMVILGFLAGRSILIFLRWYLPFSVALFILLPCIVLFDKGSRFVLLIDTILSIFTNSTWAVFTVALIEMYEPKRPRALVNGFCFFSLAGAILLTNIFISLSPVISRYIPTGTGYSVWIIGIAAVALILLSFMVIAPKQDKSEKVKAKRKEEELIEYYNEYGLSKREMEVAALLIAGLGRKEIGERLFISAGTAKNHIGKIYEKCHVDNQREFMARFK